MFKSFDSLKVFKVVNTGFKKSTIMPHQMFESFDSLKVFKVLFKKNYQLSSSLTLVLWIYKTVGLRIDYKFT